MRDGQFSEIVAKTVRAVSERARCQKVFSMADGPARQSDDTYTRADDPDRDPSAVLPFKLVG